MRHVSCVRVRWRHVFACSMVCSVKAVRAALKALEVLPSPLAHRNTASEPALSPSSQCKPRGGLVAAARDGAAVLQQQQQGWQPVVDVGRACFVLNPSGDLSGTERRMSPVFRQFQASVAFFGCSEILAWTTVWHGQQQLLFVRTYMYRRMPSVGSVSCVVRKTKGGADDRTRARLKMPASPARSNVQQEHTAMRWRSPICLCIAAIMRASATCRDKTSCDWCVLGTTASGRISY